MFEKLVSFTKKVADLPDKPTTNPKAIFDAAPDEVRQYLNKLIDALKSSAANDSGAKNIGATGITGLTGTDVQTILESISAKLGAEVEVSFTSNGSQNTLTATYTFPTAYANIPTVLPCHVTQSIAYIDTISYPYITATKTNFTVVLKTSTRSDNFGSGTAKMKFLVIGK